MFIVVGNRNGEQCSNPRRSCLHNLYTLGKGQRRTVLLPATGAFNFNMATSLEEGKLISSLYVELK